ncbi:metal ABC transporter permease [Simkania negevensis]|uniref:Metal ABC transporter permease n=1 Tax=Simkania negevensis TaxID=83561 RepID=A0ABS3ARF2_9BACT|nr:metal ABC transporter permease [Simkania negevensis]
MFQYFTDPVLRGPTMGSLLMCLSASLAGVIVFLRKRSLIGETLSHATYPGVVLAVFVAALLFPGSESVQSVAILIGAFVTALLGFFAINVLESRFRVHPDAALCVVLASFFGIGITLASQLQFSHSTAYTQVQAYLYGQAATMTDIHIVIYGALSLLIIALVILLYKEILAVNFDKNFARCVGIRCRFIDGVTFAFTLCAIVIGIRSVGLVLMSAMLIAPATTARQFTDKLYKMFIIAAVVGSLSGFLGNYLSVELSYLLSSTTLRAPLSLPTGPMIVLTSAVICFSALFFAPKRGLLTRYIRIFAFRYRCVQENLLKTFWHLGMEGELSFEAARNAHHLSRFRLYCLFVALVRRGWIVKVAPGTYRLTAVGNERAARIVRLHKMWELYLVDYLGVGGERVHKSAEEMEHIITPELEKELEHLIHNSGGG